MIQIRKKQKSKILNMFFFFLILFTVGRREPCPNEGEDVAVDMSCFKCICQVSKC